ncbi:hypothetical protein CEXT_456161 [Caerostris extrusa]|uniref:Uncharacterized protein n=1 Tax=Caerostris extrusa TaxID=172846 RepID=A0AAV4RRS8_CAEEX|nr:hypothetical protein CEXT_456161 [Caerostris extrusa]
MGYGREFLLDDDGEESLLRLIGWHRKKQQSLPPSPPFDNYSHNEWLGNEIISQIDEIGRAFAERGDGSPMLCSASSFMVLIYCERVMCVRRWGYSREFLLDDDDEESLLRLIGWTHYTDAEAIDHQSRDLATPTNTSNELKTILPKASYLVTKCKRITAPTNRNRKETTVLPTIAPFDNYPHNEWLGNEITSQIDEIGRSAFAAEGRCFPMLCSACLLGYGYDLLRKGVMCAKMGYGREFLLDDDDDEESLLHLIGWVCSSI